MNRIQKNQCLVQLPDEISHLPQCVPNLFWLSVAERHDCICLFKFRASFQILWVWVHETSCCILYVANFGDHAVEMIHLYLFQKIMIAKKQPRVKLSNDGWCWSIRSAREKKIFKGRKYQMFKRKKIKFPDCTTTIVYKRSNKLPWSNDFLVCPGKCITW